MSFWNRSSITLALMVAVAACAGERTADRANSEEAEGETTQVESPAIGESEMTSEEPPSDRSMEEIGEVSEEIAGEEADRPQARPAGGMPPAPGVEQPARNWMVITFARPVQDADLEWLSQNSFHVDTVLGVKMVRGWLEDPAAGSRISEDPRVASVSAQQR